jgi:hypothetical protein
MNSFISDDGQYKGWYDPKDRKYYASNSEGKTVSWEKLEFENNLSSVYSSKKPISESLLIVIKAKFK